MLGKLPGKLVVILCMALLVGALLVLGSIVSSARTRLGSVGDVFLGVGLVLGLRNGFIRLGGSRGSWPR